MFIRAAQSPVVLQLDFDQALDDDQSPGAHAVAAFGDASIDTGVKKHGAGSARFDGTGDYLRIAAHADFDFGAGDFTIEFWVRGENNGAFNQIMQCAPDAATASADVAWIFQTDSGGPDGSSVSQVKFAVAGWAKYTVPVALGANAWHSVAAVRSGDVLTLYVDGVAGATQNVAGTSISAAGKPIFVGKFGVGSGNDFKGNIDDLRITKGVAQDIVANPPAFSAIDENGGGSNSAPATSNATVSLVKTTASPSLPITSGRMPMGSRQAAIPRGVITTSA